jgi:hypothetical protein
VFRSIFDAIGFNPTQNQSEFGTPRVSGYGLAARSTAPMAGVDYFPTWPYRGQLNFTGSQFFASAKTESLYAETFLYRGIAPLTLQPLINKPYPYQVGARRSRGTGR